MERDGVEGRDMRYVILKYLSLVDDMAALTPLVLLLDGKITYTLESGPVWIYVLFGLTSQN